MVNVGSSIPTGGNFFEHLDANLDLKCKCDLIMENSIEHTVRTKLESLTCMFPFFKNAPQCEHSKEIIVELHAPCTSERLYLFKLVLLLIMYL